MRPAARTPTALACATLVAAVLTGCGDDDARNEPSDASRTGSAGPSVPAAVEELRVSGVATELETPWGLAPLVGGGLFVGSRDSGDILLSPPGGGQPEVVGSVDGVRAEGESGLLGLALGPGDDTLYAFRTGPEENGVVAMSWDGTRLGEPEEVVSGIPGGATYHQGGGLAVGPDRMLYVSTGDNGVPEDAQDPDSLSGKVLRYTLGGEPAPDNPSGTAVHSLGHRNVEGLVFDPEGRLWAAEFGQNAFDELNLVQAGANYGWPAVEGTGGGEEYVDPAVVWTTEEASPSGIAWWDGSLWVAALRGETLWEVPFAGAVAERPGEGEDGDRTGADLLEDPVAHLVGRYGRIRNVVATADTTMLWLATSNTDGRGEPAAEDDQLFALAR
ncbi:PQQ-dependent sugar dehydrogenase [Nocardioides dongxiaopingii]|uniref:PQQ-dependent sugar dehydrogenase n=1 Tax=Nocardioides sp. S-1144 TaxID=2582905 RepID=UPI00110E5BA8|nr:PQQ-dependent sugar dehydrogenase [Nocardioides sp. S-1144]QCW52256.1 PQQ-dependent sugar dehydrogenase [Nocardioides sp. S-1144]